MFSHGLNPCLLGSTFTNIRIYLSLPYGRPWLSEAQVITIKPPWLPPMTVLKPPPEDLNHTCCVHADLKQKTSLKRTLGYTGWGGWCGGLQPSLQSLVSYRTFPWLLQPPCKDKVRCTMPLRKQASITPKPLSSLQVNTLVELSAVLEHLASSFIHTTIKTVTF